MLKFFGKHGESVEKDMSDLLWIDDFIASIKPYIFVRKEDNLLIKMPEKTYKLNDGAVKTLLFLLADHSVKDLADNLDADQCRSLNSFFKDLKIVLSGTFCEHFRSETTEHRQYRSGYLKYPVLSEFALTWRCNIRCRFCYANCHFMASEDKVGPRNSGDELTAEACKIIIGKIKNDALVPSISFTGGEPCLRQDLPELIEYATSLGMRVNLITNGTLIHEDLAKTLKKAGLKSAQVSIESPDEKIHDALTQVEGSFRKSLQGLINLKQEDINVHPHFTINRINRDSLLKFPSFFREIGIGRFSANLLIPTGRGVDDDIAVKYSEVKDIVMPLLKESKKHQVEFLWYSPTPLCVFNPIAYNLGNKTCAACDGLLSIDPSGNVLPCSSWLEPVGNLLQDDFSQIWWSERASAIRAKEFAVDVCKTCEFFLECAGACPLYFRKYSAEECILKPSPVAVGDLR